MGKVLAATAAVAIMAGGVATPAHAAQRSGTDGKVGVAFALNGKMLKVSATKSSALRKVRGKTVVVGCVTTLYGGQYAAKKVVRWPSGTTSLTTMLPKDVSSKALGCLIESTSGQDIAFAFLG